MAGTANQDKVAAARAKNPLGTQREISKMTGVSQSSVDRIDKQLGQVGSKDPKIISLTDDDFEILQLTQVHTKERLQDAEEAKKISSRDLTYIGDVAAKRYQIFRGEITDKDGGLKNNVKELSTEDLIKLAQG